MKRKRLLFAAIALIAGALNINAQEVDFTSHLQNADMSSKDGWTFVSHFIPDANKPNEWVDNGSQDWNGPTGQTGYKCLENYAGWGRIERDYYSMTQKITLPSGTYRAESNAFYRYGLNWNTDPSKSYAYFIATTPEANFRQIIPSLGSESLSNYANSMDEASAAFANGLYKSTIEFALETESQVTFGYEGTHVLRQSWFISGPIKLYRVGDFDFTAWQTQLANDVAAANDITGIPASAKNALDAVVAQYNKNWNSVADYNTAIAAIEAAIEEAQTWVTPYSRYTSVKNAVLAVDSNVDTSDADDIVDNATTPAEVEAGVPAVRQALLTYLSTATIPEGGVDITNAIIDNPTVTQNIEYWTIENLSASGGSAGVTSNNCTEFYQRTFDFFQTITLARGSYTFGVTGFHRGGQGDYQTYFYAGDEGDKILLPGQPSNVVNSMSEANDWFNAGNGKVELNFSLDSGKDVKIGILNQDTATDKWTIFRNFTLRFNSATPDLSIYENEWAEAVAAAEAAIAANPNVTGEELTAITTAKGDTPEATKASYLEKTLALSVATQTFVNAAPAYNAYAAEKVIAEEIGVDITEEPTTAAEAAAAVNTLKVAEFNYVTTEYPYDYAPVIGDFGTWTGTATVDGQPATPNYLDYEHWSGVTHAYYEQASNGWGNPNGWTIQYEKKAKLPAGDYMLKVAARSSAGTTSLVSCSATDFTVSLPNVGAGTKGIDTSGAANFGEGNFVNNGNGFGWEWRFLPFSLTEETEVTMTFYAEAKSLNQWMSISDGTLLSKQEIVNPISIASTDAAAPEATVASEVTTDRKLFSGLNTIVLPFETTATEIGASSVLEYTGTTTSDAGNIVFNFKNVDAVDGEVTLQANVPYVVFVDEDQTNALTFGKKNVAPATDLTTEDSNGQFDFVGTYTNLAKGNSVIVAGDYIAGETAFKKVANGGNRVAAYRAYLKKVGGINSEVAFNFGDTFVDGIEAVEILNKLSGNIYNLNGQKLNNAQKGINIVNGKKLLVK